MRRGASMTIVLVLVALGAAACGGESVGPFRAKGNAICKSVKAQVARISADRANLATEFDRIIPAVEQARSRWLALAVPDGQKPAFKRFIAQVEKELQLLHDAKSAADSADVPTAQQVDMRRAAQGKLEDQAAKQVGFKACVG
jgi:hypothetical protein